MRLERLEYRVLELEKENAQLRERLAKYENPKNSHNSSIPPSKDGNRPKKNQSLRRSTGKKPDGQLGRKGHTLEMTSVPDRIIDLVPQYCNNCGLSLEKVIAVGHRTRQIVDIPPVKAVWTQYRTYGKKCDCGRCTVTDFPQGVDASKLWGQYRSTYRLFSRAPVFALCENEGNDERCLQYRHQRRRSTLFIESFCQ